MSRFETHPHGSRTELIEDYAGEAFDEVCVPTLEGWNGLDDAQRAIVYEAVGFGARAACAVLGEPTTTYDEEYGMLLMKLRASEG
jgi:hypothetical protein